MTEIRRFHFVPIGGTAMVPLAALLSRTATASPAATARSTRPCRRPSSAWAIEVVEGLLSEHVPADCHSVVVGNAALRDNVEAAEAARRGSACPLPAAGRSGSICCPERPRSSSPGRTARRRPPRSPPGCSSTPGATRGSSSAGTCRTSVAATAAGAGRTSCSRATSTTRPSSTADRSPPLRAEASSSATSSSTTPTSIRIFRR